MPGGKKYTPPVSRAQARLFGAVAGGSKTAAPGLTAAEARGKLRGVDVSALPKKAKAKKKG